LLEGGWKGKEVACREKKGKTSPFQEGPFHKGLKKGGVLNLVFLEKEARREADRKIFSRRGEVFS